MTLDSYSFVATVGWGREWLLILGCVQVHQWELSCSLMYFFFEASSGIHDWGFFFFSFLAVSHVMWDLSPRPGIKLMPPAVESTTGSPGKSLDWLFFFFFFNGRQLSICTQISIKSELTKESKEDIEWLPTCNPDSHMDWPLQTFEFRLPGGVWNLRAHRLCSLGKPWDLIPALSLINCEAHTFDLLSQKWK